MVHGSWFMVPGAWFMVPRLHFRHLTSSALLPSLLWFLPSDFVYPRENGAVRWLNRVTWAVGDFDL